MDLSNPIFSELRPEEVSRVGAGLVHSLVVVCRKHANGVFTSGKPASQKGATQGGGPESRNFRLQGKHSLRYFIQQKEVTYLLSSYLHHVVHARDQHVV